MITPTQHRVIGLVFTKPETPKAPVAPVEEKPAPKKRTPKKKYGGRYDRARKAVHDEKVDRYSVR